jgi:NAD(P)-dependent dehydrogenase (short-subunit alcohol dehydrogenase family)
VKIDGAVAIITGAASGLGRATATALHARGARVVLVDLASSDGDAVARSLVDSAHFVGADVCVPDDVAGGVDFADTLGGVRILVNCAGVATPGKVLGRSGPLSLEAFERVIRINLTGTFNTIRLAAEKMAATDPIGEERGGIIDTASVAVFDGQIGQPACAASKGGMAALTLPVARELARHLIRVVTGTLASSRHR